MIIAIRNHKLPSEPVQYRIACFLDKEDLWPKNNFCYMAKDGAYTGSPIYFKSRREAIRIVKTKFPHVKRYVDAKHQFGNSEAYNLFKS